MNTEEVVEKTMDFVKNKGGYAFARLQKVNFDKSKKVWKVEIDVGLSIKDIKTITIDDTNGEVVGYE